MSVLVNGVEVFETVYGENAWQIPAKLFDTGSGDPLGLPNFKVIEGSAPSYNNFVDIDRLLQTITHVAAAWDVNFDNVPCVTIGGKHGNASGASVSDYTATAVAQVALGDPRALFGGLVMVNFPFDEECAEALLTEGVSKGKRILDGVIAPSFTDKAIDMLARRKTQKCRIYVNPALANISKDSLDTAERFRYVRGGDLTQPNYTFVLDLAHPEIQIYGDHDNSMDEDILLAWAIGGTSNSNTITLVKGGQLIGNGVGQQDRVGAAELAIKRARDSGHFTAGASAYSDSFFPFADGVAALIAAGVRAIFSTSGSRMDKVVQDVCMSAGITLYQLPDKIARGFFGH